MLSSVPPLNPMSACQICPLESVKLGPPQLTRIVCCANTTPGSKPRIENAISLRDFCTVLRTRAPPSGPLVFLPGSSQEGPNGVGVPLAHEESSSDGATETIVPKAGNGPAEQTGARPVHVGYTMAPGGQRWRKGSQPLRFSERWRLAASTILTACEAVIVPIRVSGKLPRCCGMRRSFSWEPVRATRSRHRHVTPTR